MLSANIKIRAVKHTAWILSLTLVISCRNSNTQTKEIARTPKIIKLTDTSRKEFINVMDSLVALHSSPDDTTIRAEFVYQGKNDDGSYYLTVKITNDSLMVFKNPVPLDENQISKLKKQGNNLILSYSLSDKIVKVLAAEYEPKK